MWLKSVLRYPLIRHSAAWAAVFTLGLLPATVQAHSASENINDFYAGILHPLITPEHLLAIIAIGLLSGQQRATQDRSISWTLAFTLGLALGAVLAWMITVRADVDMLMALLNSLPTLSLVNYGSVVLFSLLVVAAWSLPSLLIYLLASLSGILHGLANGAEITPETAVYLFIPGLAVGTFIVALYCMAIADFAARRRSYRWPGIALRVSASWLAAIGLMMSGLTWNALNTIG